MVQKDTRNRKFVYLAIFTALLLAGLIKKVANNTNTNKYQINLCHDDIEGLIPCDRYLQKTAPRPQGRPELAFPGQ